MPFYLEVYNAEMEAQGIDEAFRLEFFYRVITVVKRLDCTTTSHGEERINKDIVWLKDL